MEGKPQDSNSESAPFPDASLSGTEQPDPRQDASSSGPSSVQQILGRSSPSSPAIEPVLKQTPLSGSTPILASRPPHSGWEPTTINMAKCDYCDKRRRGTLYRCKQCQIAICKACCAGGILDHDSRHTLDTDAVDWDLHPDKAEKRAKNAVAGTARGVGRKRARGGRAKKAPSSRATTMVIEAASSEEPRGEIIVAAGSTTEQDEQRHQARGPAGIFLPPPPPSSQKDSGPHSAVYEPPDIEDIQVHDQSLANSSEPQRPSVIRPQHSDPPSETRRVSHITPIPGSGDDYTAPSLSSPTTQLMSAPPSQDWLENTGSFFQSTYRNQSREELNHIGSYETYLANRDKVFRHYPYMPPLSEESSNSRYERRMSGTPAAQQQENIGIPCLPSQQTSSTGPGHIYNQGRFSSIGSVNPRMNPQFSPRNLPNNSHQDSFRRNSISLPSIRELEQSHHRHHHHLPPIQQQSQPYNSQSQLLPLEPLIHRIGSQLESDALATRQDFPAWSLDECLCHEVNRVWSRRNVQSSPLRELLRPDGPAEANVGEAFRALLGATYFAAIRLRLEIQNAARQWLVNTERQLCSDGLMMPVRASYQLGHPR